MKNCLFRILTLSVIASLLFSGCTAVTATKSSSSRSTSAVSSKGDKVSQTMGSSHTSSVYTNMDNRQIVNNISDELKSKYPDINVTNGWIGDKCLEYRYMVLFGSLKSDSRQGVAQVIRYNPDCTKVLNEQRFLEPEDKHGTLRIISLGAKDDNMDVIDADGEKLCFFYNAGFVLSDGSFSS